MGVQQSSIDTQAVIERVAALTTDFEPLPGTAPQHLDEARAAIALALAGGQQDIARPSAGPPPVLEAARSVATLVHSVLGEAAPRERRLVSIRSLPLSGATTGQLADFSN